MEFNHFSHVHGLVYHQNPQGVQIQCSGCRLPGSGNLYACWNCCYFLHEQCFQASRSLKHPSHTAHPLMLAPYPTYPSHYFICDSCKLAGHGFSYCCSECEFDLHIHCALTSGRSIRSSLLESSSLVSPFPDLSKLNLGGGQDFNPQPAIVEKQIPNMNQNGNLPQIYPPPESETGSYYQSTQHTANPPAPDDYHGSNPQNFSPNPLPNLPYPSSTTTTPSFPNAYPGINSQQYPATAGSSAGVNFQAGANSSIQETSPNDPVIFPTLPQVPAPIRVAPLSNPSEVKQVNHFSHQHPLKQIEIADSDRKFCSGCEANLTGSVYTCTESQCNFNLHKSCFELPLEIHHQSHLDHPLKLLAKPPSHYTNNQFACNGCHQTGNAFVYNCENCSFDLHVNCVSLPESFIRPDHKHPLKLIYSHPVVEGMQTTFACDVCHAIIPNTAWMYYCRECDFGTHLRCVAMEVQARKTEAQRIQSVVESQIALQTAQNLLRMTEEHGRAMLDLVDGTNTIYEYRYR